MERYGDVRMPSKFSKPIYYYDWACEFVGADVVCNSTADKSFVVRGFMPRHVCVSGNLIFFSEETVMPSSSFALKEFVIGDNDEDVHLTITPVTSEYDVEYYVLHRISNNHTAYTEMSKCEVVRHTVDDALDEFSKVCETMTDDEHKAVMDAAKVVARELKKRWLYRQALRNNGSHHVIDRKYNYE